MVFGAASKLARTIIEIVIIVAAAIALTFVVRTFVIESYEVPTGSMQSTIEPGDRVLSERISYYFRTPERGEIVTFTNPTDNRETLVKRTIAVAGDVVDIYGDNLYVNGELQVEDYVHGLPTRQLAPTYQNMTISYPFTVPEGYIWVMGDNRTNSSDSRYFGPVETSTVSGHVVFRYWPFDRFGPM